MSDVTASVDVQVPVRTAYNQWTQFESFPRFMTGVVSVRQLDDRRTHWVTEIAGVRREFDAEIVEQVPDVRIAWQSVGDEVRHSGAVTFQPRGDEATHVTVDLGWQPEGLIERAGGAVGMDRLQIKADLERFRLFIEDRGSETGQWRGRVPDGVPVTAEGKPLAGTGGHSPDDDVVDLLTAQHEQIKELMSRISAAASEGGQTQGPFTELVKLLETHELGEQRVVHPVTHESPDGGAATAEARLGEEERADQLIAKVQSLVPDSREFDMWFGQLRHAVLDHAAHEEREEFPRLRRELSSARLRAMAEELVAVQTAP
jgi:hemerythrin superfamily protein